MPRRSPTRTTLCVTQKYPLMSTHTADVVVVGAGLAGASCAYALRRRGLKVVVCEAAPAPALKASGNARAILMPYITATHSPNEVLYSAGFAFTSHLLLNELEPSSWRKPMLNVCGALQLPSTTRLRSIIEGRDPLRNPLLCERVDAPTARELSGAQITTPALYVRTAGYTDPREVVAALCARNTGASEPERLRLWCSNTAQRIERTPDGQWALHLSDGACVRTPNVVVCAAFESHTIPQLAWLPLEPIRGQTALMQPTPTSQHLRTVVCFDGYITPAELGPTPHPHLLGAHYRHHDMVAEPRHSDTAEILARCARVLPNFDFPASCATNDAHTSRVCFRTSTVDRLPYIGAVPDFDTMRGQANQYRSGSRISARVPLQLLRGLYISAGHGSRGLLSCPLGGELIARLITAAPLEELEPIATVCAPSRVVYRQLGCY